MRSFLLIGAAALVSASPAPQAFDVNAFDAIPVTLTQGPPVGPGQAAVTAYNQNAAQTTAAAAVTGAAIAQQAAKRSLEARWWIWGTTQASVKPASTPAATPTTTPAPMTTPTTTARAFNPDSTNVAPSSCTPVGWTNTWAFTSTAACPTAIEVGTYCGFVNPLDPCAAQPNAYGPLTIPDTVDAFKSSTVYSSLAKLAKTPSGYVQAFSNLGGSVEGSGYLGYKLLTSYDPSACSAYCDSTDTCTGFNIFIERDPQFNPQQCSCEAPSITQFKCSIWGQDIKSTSATNVGQNQNGFEAVIVGSNGYNKGTYTPPTLPSCTKPQTCGTKLHDQQPFCMGQKTFPGPFDPSLCAAYALAQNTANRKYGVLSTILGLFGMSKGGCVQFQAAYLEKEGHGFGTHCRLFTKKFTPSQATLDIGSGSSKWGCQKSYTWDVDSSANLNWGAGWKRSD